MKKMSYVDRDGKPLELTIQAEGNCPFCSGRFAAGHEADGVPTVVHSLPSCAEFEGSSTATEYLRSVRTKNNGGKHPDDLN